MTDIAADEFFAAFHLRQAICRALWELSQMQSTLIAEGDYDRILEVLRSKQALIDHLGRTSGEQSRLQSMWPAQRDRLSAGERQRCEAVLAETETLIATLLSAEESSSQQLITRRDATQRELQSLAVGVQAQRAYQSRPVPILSRLDLNS